MRARDLFIGFLRGYQRVVSPWLGDYCRFHPSCSEYMILSIRKNGLVLGVFDGVGRILRCHPFHPGGIDMPRTIRLSGTRAQWKKG